MSLSTSRLSPRAHVVARLTAGSLVAGLVLAGSSTPSLAAPSPGAPSATAPSALTAAHISGTARIALPHAAFEHQAASKRAAAKRAASKRAAAKRAASKRAAARRAASKQAAAKRAAALRAAARHAARPAAPAAPTAPARPAAAPTTPPAPVATATGLTAVALSPAEARLLALVNGARTNAGLPPLSLAAGSTDVARRWSVRLAQDGALSHNPQLAQDLGAAGSAGWHFLAENVGTAGADNVDGLFAAYMASEHHRDNILDPRAAYIGMGTVLVDSPAGPEQWNTMDFADTYSDAYGASRTSPTSDTLLAALPAGPGT